MSHHFSSSLVGSYLPGGYPFSPYGSKITGAEEGSDKSRASPTVTKTATDSKALDILHQHASQYKSKSPTVGDKPPHDREREQDRGVSGDRDRDRERERERERDVDRPRSSPSQRIMPTHHHLGYPLQYDLSYATGKSSIQSSNFTGALVFTSYRHSRLSLLARGHKKQNIRKYISVAC